MPLAIGLTDFVIPAGQACSAPWAHRGDEWTEITAYGAIAGTARIAGGKAYGITASYELELEPAHAPNGVGLFFRGPTRHTETTGWVPTDTERRSFTAFKTVLDRLLIDPSRTAQGPRARVADPLFFDAPLTANNTHVVQHAVVWGADYLVLAHLNTRGDWTIDHLAPVPDFAYQPYPVYMVRAVVDLDGNGTPEIVYKHDTRDAWGDEVVGYEAGAWRVVAVGVFGARI